MITGKINKPTIHDDGGLYSAYYEYSLLWQCNPQYKIDPTLKIQNKSITPKIRTIMIDWLLYVGAKLQLRLETAYLAIRMIDRYIYISRFQLLGVACCSLACHLNEVVSPEDDDWVGITDNA